MTVVPQGDERDEAEQRALIERRAYEISQSDEAGTPDENWERAEREVGANEGGLIGVVERVDLRTDLSDPTPARTIAALHGRTIHPGAKADERLAAMRRNNQRRLAVMSDGGQLLGLLCLKASRLGFCSDPDVRSRK